MSALPSDRAQAALLRALKPHAAPFAVLAARTTPWMSATFDGARHRLALRLEGEDAAGRAVRLARDLPETELLMPGGFVADVAVTARLDEDQPVIAIEALTIATDEGDGTDPAAAISRDARRAG